METNAKSLVDHWTWAANKGVMNPNTAAGLRAACTQILAVVGEGWEDTDVATLDVENLLIRFQNLRKKDFGPQTLSAYKRRFRNAVASYLKYLQDPGAWKPDTHEKPAASQRKERSLKRPSTTTAVSAGTGANTVGPGEVEYPFPLRPGVMARLILPSNLTQQDVNRLAAFMAMLVVGVDGQQPARGNSDEQ
jgi:hypothetical protein